MIRTNIRTGKYSNIFEYPNIRHTLEYTMTTGSGVTEELSGFAHASIHIPEGLRKM